MKTIKNPKKVKVPKEDLLLFDRANKRINRLEKAGIKFKQGASQFRATARAMGAQYGIKTNRLSMAKNLDEKYYKAQLQLARKIVENDAIYPVYRALICQALSMSDQSFDRDRLLHLTNALTRVHLRG